jgi:phosphate transport system protein
MPIDLQAELTELRRGILTMGAAVEGRVRQAVEALLHRDREAARVVRKGDNEIDRMELDIEEECLRILALSQPVAGDLRFVLSVMRINSEFERIGDLARSIAKRVNALSKLAPSDIPDALVRMAEETEQMLSDALTALTEEDAVLARRVRRADERVDDLQKEMYHWVKQEIPLHVESTATSIEYLSIARKLERVADLSTNISEEVIFLVEGRVVRHAEV